MAKNQKRGRDEGSISQRNGRYRVQVVVRGKRLSKTFSRKSEALAWIADMKQQEARRVDFDVQRITLGEYLLQWLDSARVTLRPKTILQYQMVVQRHLAPRLGDILLRNLGPIRIQKEYSRMIEEGIGIRTVRITHAVLHRALGRAVQYRILPYNPSEHLSLPRYRSAEMTILDEGQVTAFLVAASGHPHEALFHLAVVTGMREGELFGLQWSDLRWEEGVLSVQRQVQRIHKAGWTFQDPKTSHGRRMIRLGEGTLQVLRLHRERQLLVRAIAGSQWQDLGLIFPSDVGTPLDPSNMRKDFNRVLGEAGLPRIRFHDLRHTAASLMLNHGIAPIVVSGILGHSKPSITMDIYGHLLFSAQDEAARIMDSLVTPIRVPPVARKPAEKIS